MVPSVWKNRFENFHTVYFGHSGAARSFPSKFRLSCTSPWRLVMVPSVWKNSFKNFDMYISAIRGPRAHFRQNLDCLVLHHGDS